MSYTHFALYTVIIIAILALAALPSASALPIDRHALVSRHNITWNEPAGRLALGNGEFCFGVDGTGLQTFAGNSMSHWGWHSFPLPAGWTPETLPGTGTFQTGRLTGGDNSFDGKDAIRNWLFDNPHIINLGRLRLSRPDGRAILPGDIHNLTRTLDIWRGMQTSRYTLDGQHVVVRTCVHPTLDMVAISIESPLVKSSDLKVSLDLPYPALNNDAWVGDFSKTKGDQSITSTRKDERHFFIKRKLDATSYYVNLVSDNNCNLRDIETDQGQHLFLISAQKGDALSFVCSFSQKEITRSLPTYDQTERACEKRWASFWKSGGAIDLSGSKDPRWKELERRIVLSQYNMAAQSAGSFPSAETGLLGLDPWRGQFHMEMVWWHDAHYALWDRLAMSDKALGCYKKFAPSARKLAEQLGYKGLKWAKSVGPEGRSAPWVGNQVLLWKQPHPIFFAELEYRLRPTRATLDKWADIVQGTAEHMADYATLDTQTGIYHLTPNMPPSEQGITRDAVFDLAYWRWGLDKAQQWRQRKGLQREQHWDEVRNGLAPLPQADGVFVHSAEWLDTYTKRAYEHPDPIGVYGMLSPIDGVDQATAHRTVQKVWKTWNWNACWGWDFPWMAMAAARTGEANIAIEALLSESDRNRYDILGINTGGPCPYLPGNGGLLYAVAMMAAGWDGAPKSHAPGFPDDGNWSVKWEGLKPAP